MAWYVRPYAVCYCGYGVDAITRSTGAFDNVVGMQAIIEDYVHDERAKYALLILNTFYTFAAGFAAVYAILKLSFGVFGV